MKLEQWNKDYKALEALFHKLEDDGLHSMAEKVADRLSEMEQMDVAPEPLYVIGRHINGITLNPLEHVMDGMGEVQTYTLKDALAAMDVVSINQAAEQGIFISREVANG